jgi:cytochrome P450
MAEFRFDLFDPSVTQHMWREMAEMRATCPVARPSDGMVYTSRYDDTLKGFRDARSFSNLGGFRAPGVVVDDDELLLGEMDPPLHLDIRRFLLKVFNPGLPKRAEELTRTLVARLLDDIEAKGGGDIVSELSLPIPVTVTARLLGIPDDDIPDVTRWFFDLLHTDWPAYNVRHLGEEGSGRGIAGSAPELAGYLDECIRTRLEAADPPDDLLSGMAYSEVDGQRMSPVRVRALAVNFMTAGLSNTNLISNLVLRILQDPDLDARLRADRELVPVAIEESLRLEPPVLFLFRTATHDTMIRDEPVAAGERIVLGIASANRDEEVYPDSEEFRLDRPGSPEHLAFGAGSHLCLGNTVARFEARVAIESLLERFAPGELQLAPGFELELIPHFLEYGPAHLEVVVRRGGGGHDPRRAHKETTRSAPATWS